MPSMSTSTTSPGVSVTAWLIQLTMAGGARSLNLDPASGGQSMRGVFSLDKGAKAVLREA